MGKTHIYLTGLIILLFPLGNLINAEVWRVDWESTTTIKNGLSWDSSFNTIQEGIDAAFDSGGGDVWIAEGNYASTDSQVVQMKQGVNLYGGFIGIGDGGYEHTLTERDWKIHQTIIDGCKQKNVRCVQGASHCLIDGFTITSGNQPSGGGIFCSKLLDFRINNCILKENVAQGTNGQNGYMILYFVIVFPTPGGDGFGGGIYCANSNISITNCIFSCNRAQGGWGGIWLFGGGYRMPDGKGMGGAIHSYNSDINLLNCTFNNNNAWTWGGTIKSHNDNIFIKNSIAWNDSSDHFIKALDISSSSSISIMYSNICGGFPGEGNINQDPMFVDVQSGDLRLSLTSPCIDTGTSVPLTFDVEGNPRPVDIPFIGEDGTGEEFDMGAYETPSILVTGNDVKSIILGKYDIPEIYKPFMDFNKDGIIDISDIVFYFLPTK